MAATTNVPQTNDNSVRNLFNTMEYGPAPEATDVAKAWIADHGEKFGLFVDNKWVHPESRKTYATKNPCTGDVLAVTTQGETTDVDLAVKSAKTAYGSWSKLSCHARARYIYSIARHMQKHQRLISVVESLDNGKSIRETRDLDIPIVIRHLYHHTGWAELMEDEMKNWKPVGVIGAIVPWNFPLMLLSWKVCPALAMGNTVVLKPATFTRLSALLFAEICAEAGLPPGVFNVVTGGGAMGSILATHPDVDKVAFTGSTDVGKILRRATAGSGKKLSLELGGKSAVIVFDSADIDSAVEGVVDAIYFNQGQVCSAGSKLLVQESVYDKVISRVKERMTHLRLGSSLDKAVDMGAVVDQSQKKTVEEYVKSAHDEGAQVYQACTGVPSSGLYFPPTLITHVQTTSKVVVEEIFGPVLVALSFRTAKEAVALANNSIYGLGGSVWSEDLALAVEVARNVKTGTMWINSHNVFDAAAGFGGYKQSGFGRDGGKEGLFEYVKPAWSPTVKIHDLDMAGIIKTYGTNISDRPNITQSTENDSSFSKPPKIDHTYKLYYGGAQKRPDGNYSHLINDHEGKVIAEVSDSNRKDVRNAVEAAQKSQPGWEKRTGHNKAQILYYIAENVELRKDEFAQNIMKLTGVEKSAAEIEVDITIQRLFYWAAYSDKFGGNVQETQMYGTVIKLHEPIGVIGIACPDEYPLLGFVSLFAPAIARGNAVVIIPSEKCPLPALDMYQIFDTSDVPGGVINILTGNRSLITKFLTEHQDIQAMWYQAGDVEGSAFVEHVSAVNVKRTWVNYGNVRNWNDSKQGQGEEFLYHSIQCKNIWLPMGEIFAN